MGAQAVRLSNVDIDNALKNRDFEVLFQPIFDLGNGALARMETFVRWRHASLGLLPPGAFISFFESQGRMSELTRYVLAQALHEYRTWRGPSAPGFSINLALSDLSDEAFVSHFQVMLRDCGFPAELITLECPMPPVDQPTSVAARHFERLADTGARLAIEVRGRANDFLRNVDPFPFDEIKTGGAAILRFARTVRGPGLSAISELLEIAQKANAAIIAVGVEDQASLAALRGLGFAAAQGNHLGKVGDLKSFTPARVNEVRTLLGLEALSTTDLHALFRTAPPALQTTAATAASPSVAAKEAAPAADALVERLAARIARQDEAAPPPAPVGVPASGLDPARAAARAAKAAAIAKAKQKARLAREAPAESSEPAARELQQRLTRAFGVAERQSPIAAAADEFDVGEGPQHAEAADAPASAERALAAEAAEDAPPLRMAADGSPRFLAASLSVGSARAYFRPGLRVGVMGPTSPPGPRLREAPPLPPLGEAPASAAAAAPAALLAPISAEKGQARTALDEADIPADEPAAVSTPAPEGRVEAPAAATQRNARPKRRRGFLQRTVIPYPTHFWPTSWRRAWKRRRQAIEARSGREAAE